MKRVNESARVLTYEEVCDLAHGQQVVYEDRDWILMKGLFHEYAWNSDGQSPCAAFTDVGVIAGGHLHKNKLAGGHSFPLNEYNETWRVWNDVPSKELMKKTKWETLA